VDEITDVAGAAGRFVLWRAIQPELTHCHAIQAINFDVHEERGTTDSFEDSIEFSSTERWPWQRIVMTIVGGRLGQVNTAGPVELDFTGVIYFQFIEAEFNTDYVAKTSTPEDVDVWYDQSGLDESAGFGSSPTLESLMVNGRARFGAFCLWECDSSPLVDRLVMEWRKPGTTIEQRRRVLRHFSIGCDETGSFQIVARSVFVRRVV
jgi:hypothetical protein